MQSFFEKAEEYVKDSGIAGAIASAPAVLCAFSGGADSSVLLRFLAGYCKSEGKALYAAHVNHMIRGEDADADEDFCRETCKDLGIGLFVLKTDVPKEAKESGEGLEEAARRIRYAFLEKTAKELSGAVIATAHNATDNLETVVFNLARGTSVHGLGGIAPQRDNIIRPLLFATGDEIREFAKESNIPYVTDATNADTDYTRNLIRHTVVPALRRINPRADGAALRLSAMAREDDRALGAAAERFLGGRKYIPRNELASLDRATASRVIMLLCEREGGRKNVTEKNVDDCMRLILSGKVGTVSVHGCDVFVHRDAVFCKKETESEPAPGEVLLKAGELAVFGEYLVGIFEKEDDIPPADGNIYNLFIKATLNRGKMYGDLFVRCRREGDTYLLRGVRRKLKKLMCDEKIPQRDRDTLPLLCDGKGIVLVPTLPPSDGAAGNDIHVIIFRKKEAD